MRSVRPSPLPWRTAARLAAVALLGWGAWQLGPGMRGPRPAEKPRPTRHLWIAISLGAVLMLGAAGAGWYILQRGQTQELARAITGGEPDRAPPLMIRYGCGGCHAIPGVPGADGRVAAPLAGLRERVYVGGVARNTAENLVAWIVNPRTLSPRSAMPVTGITEAEARDVAAYLYAN